MRHFPEPGEETAPPEARRMAEYLGGIVEWATMRGGEKPRETDLRCRNKIDRKGCPGRLRISLHPKDGEVRWSCPGCRDKGVIRGWVDGPWDWTHRRPLEVPNRGWAARGIPELVQEALVDCYDEDEALAAFCTLMEEEMAFPFETEILGIPAQVEKLDLAEGTIVAVCRRGSRRQRIPVLDLPLPDPPPKGSRWIEAYRFWRMGK